MNDKKVFFLLLTHSRPESVCKAIESISLLSMPPDYTKQVLIFDNGSNSSSRQLLRKLLLDFKIPIDLFSSTRNFWMIGKRVLELLLFDLYQGSENDYVVHVDDDVVLSTNWFASCLSACQLHGWDACGSIQQIDNSFYVSGQEKIVIEEVYVDAGVVKVWRHKRKEILEDFAGCEVEFAGHRALCVKFNVAQKVLHDKQMLIGGEDLDYSLSLRAVGCKIGVGANTLIKHRSNEEEEIRGFRTLEKVHLSWRRFYEKWGFVRDNACSEVGMPEKDWLSMFI